MRYISSSRGINIVDPSNFEVILAKKKERKKERKEGRGKRRKKIREKNLGNYTVFKSVRLYGMINFSVVKRGSIQIATFPRRDREIPLSRGRRAMHHWRGVS